MTTSTRSGIPTTYHETRFRSRLEARWAAFFDLVGWRWTYEPFDADGWIPDFLIHGPAPFLVEVGPCTNLAELEAKAEKPRKHLDHPTLVVGVDPCVEEPFGMFVNEFPLLVQHDGPGSTGPAFWHACVRGDLVVFGDAVNRPCAHQWSPRKGIANLPGLWSQAGNIVQWSR